VSTGQGDPLGFYACRWILPASAMAHDPGSIARTASRPRWRRSRRRSGLHHPATRKAGIPETSPNIDFGHGQRPCDGNSRGWCSQWATCAPKRSCAGAAIVRFCWLEQRLPAW